MNLASYLDRIEYAGNKLPHPTIMFIWLCVIIIAISFVCALFSIEAVHPISQQTIAAQSLFSVEGLHFILTKTVNNFVTFAPVGTVLVAMIGLGLADKSGLIDVLLKASVAKAPPKFLTFIVVLAGILSNIAADSGYVILIPLAAIVFKNAGRAPLAGMAAAFAGVSGGYSANLLIGPVDAILSGISTEAAQIVTPDYVVSAAANYYFMIASTFLVAIAGTWVTEKFVSPRFEQQNTAYANNSQDLTNINKNHEKEAIDLSSLALNPLEKRGLKWVGAFTLFTATLLLMGIVPENGVLRNPSDGAILTSPFIKGIVSIIALYAGLCGVIFGKISGTLASGVKITEAMDSTMATMGSYLVLTFFAAQFVSYFNWSQLGIIIAINGANLISAAQLNSGLLLVAFIFIAAFINLFIGSASAKWALVAPVFVPMLYLVGISPEATQVAFRIGDSSTNIITPLMPYFGVILAFVQKYKQDSGVGTIVAMMLPYSLTFLFSWTLLLIIWYTLGLPLGPGAEFNL